MPKPKPAPVIYLSRVDWANIVTASLKRAGMTTDAATHEAAMNYPLKKLMGFPVIIDESLPNGEPVLLGFGPGRAGYENQVKVLIRNSARVTR